MMTILFRLPKLRKVLLTLALLLAGNLSAAFVEFWGMTSVTGVNGNVLTEVGTVILNGSPNCTV